MGLQNMSKDEKHKGKGVQVGNASHSRWRNPAETKNSRNTANLHARVEGEGPPSAMRAEKVVIARAPLAQLRFDEGRPGDVVGPGRGMRIFRSQESLPPTEPSES